MNAHKGNVKWISAGIAAFMWLGTALNAAGQFTQAKLENPYDGEETTEFGQSVCVDGDTLIAGSPDNFHEGEARIYRSDGQGGWTREALVTGAGTARDGFGYSVSISGDTAVVGTGQSSGVTSLVGEAYVFTRTGGVWTRQAVLTPDDPAVGQEFGHSVCVEGDSIIVGTRTRSAYVFTRTGTSWSQQAKLTPPGSQGDRFAFGVAIDGDTAVAGAPWDGSQGSLRGATYVFLRTGTTWAQQAKFYSTDGVINDEFGTSVAIAGNTIIVGAVGRSNDAGRAYAFIRTGTAWAQQSVLTPNVLPGSDAHFGDSVSVDGDNAAVGTNQQVGKAYVFVRSGTTWTHQTQVADDVTGSIDFFGKSVSISGDTLAVGSPGADDLVYVFEREGTAWSQQAKLDTKQAAAGDRFGISAAMWGDTAVIGARDAYLGGRAYVFVRSGETWTQQAELRADDFALGDFFGETVAIHEDTILIGAYREENQAGAAYVFTRTGGVWTQQAKLTAPVRKFQDFFGVSVAVYGETALIGAYGDDDLLSSSGAAYVFTRTGTTWTQQAKLNAGADAGSGDLFAFSVALSGDTAVVGAPQDDDGGSNSGSAYVFVRTGTAWGLEDKLTAADPAANDGFGQGVAVSGDAAVVGAYQDDDKGNTSGSAYVFRRAGGNWSQEQKLLAEDGGAGDEFGRGVAIDGNGVVVGADKANRTPGGSDHTGFAYYFVQDGGTWQQHAKLSGADSAAGNEFGAAVAIAGERLLAGAPSNNGPESASGGAYVFSADAEAGAKGWELYR